MRWADEPFPRCCLHCDHHLLTPGECGHAQRELCVLFFAKHPEASCPIYGEPDVEPTADNPIASAIDRGVRYRDRLPDDVVAGALFEE